MICDDESVGLDRMTTMYLTHCRWLILTLVAPEVGVEAFDLVKKVLLILSQTRIPHELT